MALPPAAQLFLACIAAIDAQSGIEFRSASDKEYGFQDWVKARLADTGLAFTESGRNGYPDLKLDSMLEGFEVKSLRHPGRVKTLDTNSRPPGGYHDGRTVYYVFGRYTREADSVAGAIRDLVIYHGDLIDPTRDSPRNHSFKTYGRYGDIMVRDRKMYVPKTAQGLLTGLDDEMTLILPSTVGEIPGLVIVNTIERVEADQLVSGYTFEFGHSSLTTATTPNEDAGKKHTFNVYRPTGRIGSPVALKPPSAVHLKDIPEDLAE